MSRAARKKPVSSEAEGARYESRAFIRVKRPFKSWVSWNSRLGGGPLLTVRHGSFELSAPQGMMLESRDLVIEAGSATMWPDKVGWAGTRLDRKECIHVVGRDQRGRVEVAISPRDGIRGAWQALLASGVRPRTGTQL